MYKKNEEEVKKIEIPFDVQDWSRFHTGIYFKEEKEIAAALEHTMARLVRLIPSVKKSSKILVFVGANPYPAIFLGARYGSKIDCVVTNEAQSVEVIKMAKFHGIEDKLTVHMGSLEKTMFSDANFDMIWSLDALHTTEDKKKAIREAARLLVPEGRFIFCDYIKKESGETKDGLEYLTGKEYQKLSDKADLERVYLREMAVDASKHHAMILEKIESDKKKISKELKPKELEALIADITLRKSNLDNGVLDWGFFQFQKRNV